MKKEIILNVERQKEVDSIRENVKELNSKINDIENEIKGMFADTLGFELKQIIINGLDYIKFNTLDEEEYFELYYGYRTDKYARISYYSSSRNTDLRNESALERLVMLGNTASKMKEVQDIYESETYSEYERLFYELRKVHAEIRRIKNDQLQDDNKEKEIEAIEYIERNKALAFDRIYNRRGEVFYNGIVEIIKQLKGGDYKVAITDREGNYKAETYITRGMLLEIAKEVVEANK